MLKRDEWMHLSRKLDWNFSYVDETDIYPEILSGKPFLSHSEWKDWDEPFKTSYEEYVKNQYEKDLSVFAVRDAVGSLKVYKKKALPWINGVKLHASTLPLAEFGTIIGELRGARFGRDGAWRNMAVFGAMDELRHVQIPLLIMHPLVQWDPQFDWTHKLYHTNSWFAVAGRHFFDEIFLGSSAIEFALATNFVFETGFTNLQFIALSSLANEADDHMFEKMIKSIQTDESRHDKSDHRYWPRL